MGNYLGTGTKGPLKSKRWSFEASREWARRQHFTSMVAFRNAYRIGVAYSQGIPAIPKAAYSTEWQGAADFFGWGEVPIRITKSNCVEVATQLHDKFGHVPNSAWRRKNSYGGLTKWIRRFPQWFSPLKFEKDAPKGFANPNHPYHQMETLNRLIQTQKLSLSMRLRNNCCRSRGDD